MGREEIAALVEVLTAELAKGRPDLVAGTWTIQFDKERRAFVFDKCEGGGYCEERPVVIGFDGAVLDAGGPLFA